LFKARITHPPASGAAIAVPQAKEPPKARTAMIRNAMTAAKVSREARRRVRVALIPLARCTAVTDSNIALVIYYIRKDQVIL
jgi:hypothetical protein